MRWTGIVVVDFSRVLAGPYATMMLGDFGAEVIKVERPGTGDDTRHWGPPHDSSGVATYFNAVNRNKRSVALDLTDPADLRRARHLVSGADIVVENFRAGTMEKLGLGYDDVRQIRPDVIYCSITGFGREGGAALPGYDLLVQAVGGLMSVTGTEPGDPTKAGVALVDVLAGLHALSGILAALAHRDRTGQGQRVDTNLLAVLLSSLVNQASGYLGAGVVPGMMGNRHPSIAPYQTFDTADRPIAIAVGNDKQFRAFAAAIGRPEWADDPRFVTNPLRVANRDALCALIETDLGRHGADHWYRTLTDVGVPAGPINDVSEAFAFARDLGIAATVSVPGSPTLQVANPITLSATPVRYRSASAAAGRRPMAEQPAGFDREPEPYPAVGRVPGRRPPTHRCAASDGASCGGGSEARWPRPPADRCAAGTPRGCRSGRRHRPSRSNGAASSCNSATLRPPSRTPSVPSSPKSTMRAGAGPGGDAGLLEAHGDAIDADGFADSARRELGRARTADRRCAASRRSAPRSRSRSPIGAIR